MEDCGGYEAFVGKGDMKVFVLFSSYFWCDKEDGNLCRIFRDKRIVQ